MTIKYYFLSLIFLQSLFCAQECFPKKSHRVASKKFAPAKLSASVKLSTDSNEALFKNIQDWNKLPASCDMKRYYAQTDTLGGWFDKRLIIIMFLIDTFQEKNGISGNLAEIGVWHGKSFIPLMHMAKKNESVAAIDCFEDYQFNRDNSGGFLKSEHFLTNVHKYCSDTTKLTIIKGDSVTFSANDYLNAMNNGMRFRVFSIDGCHQAEPTEIDMSNAFNSITEGGVIIMDDYFHWCWPGVSEGVNKFMNKNAGKLKPFLIGLNKIFFATAEFAKKYFDNLKEIFRPQDLIITKFFDVETLVYDPKT